MKMKKIVMGLVMALFAMNAMAANIKWWTQSVEENLSQLNTPVFANAPQQTRGSDHNVLWASVGEKEWSSCGYDSVIHTETGVQTVKDYYGDNLVDAMYRITLPETGEYLRIYIPGLGWEDGEFGLEIISDGGGYDFGHTGAFEIPTTITDTTMVRMELGLYVPDGDDWMVDIFAYSAAVPFSELYGAHTSGSPIPPPTFNDWMPRDFYTSVPEPSTAILALLGTCLLLKRRRNPTHV